MNKMMFMLNLTIFVFAVPLQTLSATQSPYASLNQLPPEEPDTVAPMPIQNPTYVNPPGTGQQPQQPQQQ